MNRKKELRIGYGLTIALLVIGVISYTAFSAKAPKNPLRIMYKASAGNVLFDHKTHAAESGYGILCSDCHHHPEDNDTGLTTCYSCHKKGDNKTMPKSCLDCHEADEIEGTTMKNSMEAFHEQCSGCHEASKQGPVECGECHAM